VAVEGLDAGEDLAVVSAGDQDLGARADSGLEDGEGPGGELMFLDLGDFVFTRKQLGRNQCAGFAEVVLRQL
jgi:hypothetical protein